ncbi:MAG: GNAT family N-acetyltransferase, partial [Geminicoccaceae bacterium]
RYYPKLQVAVPFTPVPGPRLLARPDVEIAKTALIEGLLRAAAQIDCSSLHITFCEDQEWQELGSAGMMQRTGVQYHWHNRGYESFDDFLAGLKSSKRKMIRKERAKVKDQGLDLETLTGEALTPEIWDHFYPFYRATVDKRWGGAYLKKRFFKEIGALIPERIVLVMVRHEGRYVAGALNLLGNDTLFGRNWGCLKDFDFLHFEACYYAAIDFAIEHGLARVEAGAQGQHKLQRGYEPVPTYSAHWIRDPNFRDAVERFLRDERKGMAFEREQLRKLLPFRESDA